MLKCLIVEEIQDWCFALPLNLVDCFLTLVQSLVSLPMCRLTISSPVLPCHADREQYFEEERWRAL